MPQGQKEKPASILETADEAVRLIDEIDLDLFNQQFRSLLLRCGVDPARVTHIDKSTIFAESTRRDAGAYSPDHKMIGINFQLIDALQIPERAKRLFLLTVLFHEAVHAISFFSERERTVRVGLATNAKDDKLLNDFRGLEEAFTELIAQDFTTAYLNQSGWMSRTEQERLTSEKNFPKPAYQNEIAAIERLTDYLKRITGLSKETVKQAFIREKLEGGSNVGKELRDLFCDAMGDDRGHKLWRALALMGNPARPDGILLLNDALDEQEQRELNKGTEGSRRSLKSHRW